MLNAFRLISVIEGISWLLLLFVAMPLKYHYGQPAAVSFVGMAHGMLFIAFILSSLISSHKLGWSVAFWLLTLLCSIIPFAFIALEWQLRKNLGSKGEKAMKVTAN